MKKSVITGVTGQDGAYLAAELLAAGHAVYGAIRRTSSVNLWRLEELDVTSHPNFKVLEFDLLDPGSCLRLIEHAEPDIVYNLAAQSFVGASFAQPVATAQMTGVGPLHMLEAIRQIDNKIKFYQASTSELYGRVRAVPQNEETPFYPRSPYAVAKLFGHWTTVNYREAYGLFASSGILFNHESPLRGREFVTRKITNAAARIHLGKQDWLEIGNLDARRDWGFAKEYTHGMTLIMNHNEAADFVLATGKNASVRDFAELAFAAVDIELQWRGKGVEEEGICKKTGKRRVRVNPELFRPAEVDELIGDPTRAQKLLGWRAHTTLQELARLMVEADIRRNESGFSF
ncbi:MAG TPA: GDP-mannose 4,6-dehydratase [Candidatus Binataceae bacterium]|nr:GDP-mannose 4,6-dehydratase [Candidatus Binataceae bacterium]